MVAAHSITWWFIYPTYRLPVGSETAFSVAFIIFGALVMFLPVAGGIALWYMSRKAYDASTRSFAIWRSGFALTMIVRAAILATLGTVMTVVTWGPSYAGAWNVLQFYALSLVCLTITLGIGGVRAVWALGIFSFITAWFVLDIQLFLAPTFVSNILFGNPSSIHIWPLFPWLYIIVIGFAVAELYNWAQRNALVTQLLWWWASLGILTLVLIIFTYELPAPQLQASGIWDFSARPPVLLIIAMISVFFITLPLIEWSQKKIHQLPITIFEAIGYAVLPVYLLHMPSAFRYFNGFAKDKDSHIWLGIGFLLQLLLVCLVTICLTYYRKRDLAVSTAAHT